MISVSGEHYHKLIEEFYYIKYGKGTIFLDGIPYKIEEGNLIVIPRGVRHYTIPDSSLEVLVISSPAWSEEDIYK